MANFAVKMNKLSYIKYFCWTQTGFVFYSLGREYICGVCFCTCVHIEANRQSQASFSRSALPCSLRQGHSLAWSLQSKLGQMTTRIHLSLPTLHYDHKCMLPCPAFKTCLHPHLFNTSVFSLAYYLFLKVNNIKCNIRCHRKYLRCISS